MKKFILGAILVALLLSGCSSEKTGNFQLYLTDASIAGLEHVYVTISGTYLRKQDGNWTDNILSDSLTLDLLSLRDREDMVAEVKLQEGTYTGIKLVVSAASVVADTRTFAIAIDPAYEVVIPAVFTIRVDGIAELVLDFDAGQSLRDGGNGQYLLVPVIVVKRIGY
jgi:hypothetical protein